MRAQQGDTEPSSHQIVAEVPARDEARSLVPRGVDPTLTSAQRTVADRPSMTSMSSMDSVFSATSSSRFCHSAGWERESQSSCCWSDSGDSFDLESSTAEERGPRLSSDATDGGSVSSITSVAFSGIQALQKTIRDLKDEQDMTERLVANLGAALTGIKVRSRQRALSHQSQHTCSSSSIESSSMGRKRRHRVMRPAVSHAPNTLPECKETSEDSSADETVHQKVQIQTSQNTVKHSCDKEGLHPGTCFGVHDNVETQLEDDNDVFNQRRQSAPHILQLNNVPEKFGEDDGKANELTAEDVRMDESHESWAHIHLWMSDQQHTWC